MRLCVRFASLRSVGLLLVVSLPLAGCAGNATKLLQVGAASTPIDGTLGVTPPNNQPQHSQPQHSQPQRVASLDIAATNDASPTFPVGLTGGGAEPQTESSSSAEYPRTTQSKGTQIAYGTDRFVNQSRSVNQAEALPDGDVVLNFSDTDIREVAQSVLGDVLKLNFVVDIESQARITLRTNRPIPKSSVLPTLETTLAASGLALAREGEVYRIVPAAKAKGSGRLTRVLHDASGLRAGFNVVAVPLRFVAPSQMAKIVEPMAPAGSILNVDDTRNLMIVSATGPELSALLDTIDMFDVDGMKGMSFGYFKLQKSRVGDVTKELKSVMAAHASSASVTPPQVVTLDRLNALLVIAPRQQSLKLVTEWVERLDKAEKGDEQRLFVFHVKNRKAKEVATLLESVFQKRGTATTSGSYNQPSETGNRDEIDSPQSPNGPMIPPEEKAVELSRAGVKVAAVGDVGLAAASSDSSLRGAPTGDELQARIVADEEHNTLIIRARQSDYEVIVQAIESMDLVAPLVMIEVTIAEIKLEDGLKFGIEWFFKNKHNKATFSALDTGQILSKFPGFSYFFSAADVAAVLNALADVTDVRIVSSPRIMVRDNRTASLQIGDQVPVLTSTARSITTPDAPIVQTVQYFDTGVILKVTPQVNARGLVAMDVVQEVSNVATDKEDGIESPTIQQRKISSSISVHDGEAVVLGGLMRESRSNTTTGVPLLSDIPGLGEVFKTHDRAKDRTELMVVITPRVVWGRSDAQLITEELRGKLEDVANTRNRGTRAFIGDNGRHRPDEQKMGYSTKD